MNDTAKCGHENAEAEKQAEPAVKLAKSGWFHGKNEGCESCRFRGIAELGG
jgi:hypothetical protein